MNDLPKGIRPTDLKSPSYKDQQGIPYEDRQFELWHVTGFGWCVPTLEIRRSSRPALLSRRTYAVRLSDKGIVRIGMGPHVTERVVVHVRTSRLEALRPFLALRTEGESSAHQIRDRISSRRARTQLARSRWF